MNQGGSYQRHLRASVLQHEDSPDGSGYYSLLEANMTLPTRLSADDILFEAWNKTLDNRKLDSNRSVTIVTPYPVTETRCWFLRSRELNPDTIVKYIKKDGSSSGDLLKLGEYADRVSDYGKSYSMAPSSYQRIAYPTIWIASPEDGSDAVIAVLFTMMDWSSSESNTTYKVPSLSQTLAKDDSDIDIKVGVCTLSASWTTGEVQWIDTAGTTLIQTASFPALPSQETYPIRFNLTDMGILNSTDFAHEMRGGNALYLAGSLADALAEVRPTTTV
ncbi:hypothetical protein E8E11_005828 [Didymella keratinophila]|nr:hypothetical protein E8E11_005828 [Didymella keratinophila]